MNLNIIEWTEAYLKYKDTIHRRIKNITKKEKTITVENKDGTKQEYLCVNDLDEIKKDQLKNKRISCLNKKKNLDWIIKNWKEIKETNTIFLMANPQKASHWTLNPKLHNNISDKTSLKTGLKTLFESIPEV